MNNNNNNNVVYNLDKRTQRKVDSNEFITSINKLKNELNRNSLNLFNINFNKFNINSNISLYVRKRPIFLYEIERGEYDVLHTISKNNNENENNSDGVIVSQCTQSIIPRRGIVRQLNNVFYPCTKVFDETINNDEIYEYCGKPLLNIIKNGGIATCFMFGQTGSGKTYTMSSIQEYLSYDIFKINNNSEIQMEMIFYELVGKKVYDLFHDDHKELKLLTDSEGRVHVVGATRIQLNNLSPEEIILHQKEAQTRRETASTCSNATSSRSHAICQIYFSTSLNPTYGLLTLVDLAGSERKEDSLYHDRVTQQQTAEINTSLMTLKECLRIKSLLHLQDNLRNNYHNNTESNNINENININSLQQLHIPYRNSNLTKILKESFEFASSPLINTPTPTSFIDGESKDNKSDNNDSNNEKCNMIHVILTLTPTVTNTEHTISTLNLIGSVLNLYSSPSSQSNSTSNNDKVFPEYIMEVSDPNFQSRNISASSDDENIESVSTNENEKNEKSMLWNTCHPKKWTTSILNDWIEYEMRIILQQHQTEVGQKIYSDIQLNDKLERIKNQILNRNIAGKDIMKWNEKRIVSEILEIRENNRLSVNKTTNIESQIVLNKWGKLLYQALRNNINQQQIEEERLRKEFLNEKQKKLSTSSVYSHFTAPKNPKHS